MPFSMSTTLRSRLPKEEREGIEEALWAKSGERCYLCEGEMNRASDHLVADHDTPDSDKGPTTLGNLNMVHRDCNAFKRDAPSVDVRPFLRLKKKIEGAGGLVRYGDCLPLMELQPRPSVVEVPKSGGPLRIDLPDGRKANVPIYSERTPAGHTFRYAFVEVPLIAIHNDEECQPRTIKLEQLWKIYSDLQKNPLHEPPSCRVVPIDSAVHLAMFDGQHKTIATWLIGRDHVAIKLYLDLDTPQTIYLVNSVQAKIGKLPLSAFEMSRKLSEEWRAKQELYWDAEGMENASEKGFIKWVPAGDRRRLEQAMKAALVDRFIDLRDELSILEFVKLAGTRGPQPITETVFRSKVLGRLLYMNPLLEKGPEGEKVREREAANVIKVLNAFVDAAFRPIKGASELSEREKERIRRMTYQASLYHIAGLLRGLVGHVMDTDTVRAMLDREPDAAQWAKIRAGIQRIVDHPVWYAPLDASPEMAAVNKAFRDNQDVEDAFGAVGLRTGYVIGGDKKLPQVFGSGSAAG